MATQFSNIYNDVINRLRLDTNDSALVTRVKGYINDNYKSVANKYDWPWLYEKATIVVEDEYSTGDVTVTNGSTTVTGSGTTFTSGMVGRKFKVDGFDEIYTIASFTSATVIELDNDYNGETSSDESYSIFQDVYSLPGNCDHIITIRQHRSPTVLKNIGLRELRRSKPSPDIKNADPIFYAYYEPNSSTGNQQIILWPPPYRQLILDYEYKLLITELSDDTNTPLIPEQYRQLLKWMTMADLYGHEKDDDRTTYYETKALAMINEMRGKYIATDDFKIFVPPNLRRESHSLQSLADIYDLGDVFDRY